MEQIRTYCVDGSELGWVWCVFRVKTFRREVLLPGRYVIPKTYASMFIPGHMHKIRYYINCNIPICWEYKYLAKWIYILVNISPKVWRGRRRELRQLKNKWLSLMNITHSKGRQIIKIGIFLQSIEKSIPKSRLKSQHLELCNQVTEW